MKPHVLTSLAAFASAFAALALAAGCGSAPHAPPLAPQAGPDLVAEHGHALFDHYCYKCHPGGGAGLGPSLDDRRRPELAIRTQIRQGVGAMPAFDDNVLRDVDVDALARYVAELPATAAGPDRVLARAERSASR